MSADHYTYRVTWSAEDGEQGVSQNRLASAKLAA